MPNASSEIDEQLIAAALAAASHTRELVVERGARHSAARIFDAHFGSAKPFLVADQNTFRVAGKDVADAFRGRCGDPFIFGPHVYAEYACVEELEAVLSRTDAIPVAVGSGTINDLTKLVSHHLQRPYMVVGTAASMDGYTSFGASITRDGTKQNMDCAAPRAVVADLDVIAGAPEGMNASGYADLLAKTAAGADWILADAAGDELIQPSVWDAIQSRLRVWVGDPRGVATNDPVALRYLSYGLMMAGFAMQAMRSSRPAAGAEHQFSHLWDMQHHKHEGVAPSHGVKVGIGTLSSLALHDDTLRRNFGKAEIDEAVRKWPSFEAIEARIVELLGRDELGTSAIEESRVKYLAGDALRRQLEQLSTAWPAVRSRIERDVPRFAEAYDMFRAARCPHEPEQIGITRERLRVSYEMAEYIRRRYTILDFAHRFGYVGDALDGIFGPNGAWAVRGKSQERNA
jgi:glycerol-1-phosphate dehydrogenase [NAD(P)+]